MELHTAIEANFLIGLFCWHFSSERKCFICTVMYVLFSEFQYLLFVVVYRHVCIRYALFNSTQCVSLFHNDVQQSTATNTLQMSLHSIFSRPKRLPSIHVSSYVDTSIWFPLNYDTLGMNDGFVTYVQQSHWSWLVKRTKQQIIHVA